jgi:protein TonB
VLFIGGLTLAALATPRASDRGVPQPTPDPQPVALAALAPEPVVEIVLPEPPPPAAPEPPAPAPVEWLPEAPPPPSPAPMPRELSPAPAPMEAPADEAAPAVTHGTSVRFVNSPAEAARRARGQDRLLFVLHISGNFEDPGFT